MNPQRTTSTIWYIPKTKNFFGKKDDVLSAAERYIEENGTEAFERLIRKVCNFTCLFHSWSLISS